MEEISNENSGEKSVENATADPSKTLGSTLREAREKLGLKIADVADQVKFAPRQIEALEADDFANLPELAFVRGFVRSYAKVLQLDAQPLLAMLPGSKAAEGKVDPASVEVPFSEALTQRQQNMLWLGAALVAALIAAGFGLWHLTAPVQPEVAVLAKSDEIALPVQMEVMAASPVELPEMLAESTVEKAVDISVQNLPASAIAPSVQSAIPVAKPLVTAPVSLSSGDIRIVFTDESWAEVRDAERKLLSSQVNAAGSELRLDGRAPFSLVIGRASAVKVFRGVKQIDMTPYVKSTSEVARLTVE